MKAAGFFIALYIITKMSELSVTPALFPMLACILSHSARIRRAFLILALLSIPLSLYFQIPLTAFDLALYTYMIGIFKIKEVQRIDLKKVLILLSGLTIAGLTFINIVLTKNIYYVLPTTFFVGWIAVLSFEALSPTGKVLLTYNDIKGVDNGKAA